MLTNGKTLKFRAAKLKGFTVYVPSAFQTSDIELLSPKIEK